MSVAIERTTAYDIEQMNQMQASKNEMLSRYYAACERVEQKIRGLRRGPIRTKLEKEFSYLIKEVRDYGFDFYADTYVLDKIKEIEDLGR